MKKQFDTLIPVELANYLPRLLKGDDAKEFEQEFKERAKKDYPNTKGLNVFRFSDKTLTGSSTVAAVLANQILAQNGLRTINQAEAETIKDSLRENYVDTGLVLKGTEEKNHDNYVVAEYLIKQLKKQNSKIKFPVVINLYDLTLENSSNSKYGLVFKLNEDAKPIYAKILDRNKNDTRFGFADVYTENLGLVENIYGFGKRGVWTRPFGISRQHLNILSNFNTINDDLTYSSSRGRIVVVSAEGATSKNLDAYVKKLEAEKQRQIKDTENRFRKAYEIITGN